MNTRQLHYALKLSQSLNFSQVAEQLNISQPALSKQIIHLENEIGVKIFDRSTTPLSLTPAGEYFISEVKDLLYKEDQLLRSMERFKSGKEGRLTIGVSPFRSQYLLPPIVKKIRNKYAGIQIHLREVGSDILRKEAEEGLYDFAIINLPVNESILDVIPLEPDTLVLAVPNTLLHLMEFSETEIPKQISFEQCSKLPFIVVGQSQEMRHLFNNLCDRAEFHPHVAMEVVGLSTAWSMCQAGIGATLLPLQFLSSDFSDQDTTLFSIKDCDYQRQPAIVTRRNQYLSEYAQYAIELFQNSKT